MELHYFDQFYDKGLAWYQKFFAQSESAQAIGEKTASYFYVPECAERIKRTLETVRLVVVLRNPIDRAYSHYRRWIAGRTIALTTSFRDCFRTDPRILEMGNYYDHLIRYLDYFSMDDILVLFSDDLFRAPSQEIGHILRFLGLDDDHSLDVVGNYNQTPKVYRFGAYVLPQRVARAFEKRLPLGPAKGLRDLIEHRFEPISDDDRDYLKEYYSRQNEKLFKLLNSPKCWS